MKITWKEKKKIGNSRKRCLSFNPELHFDDDDSSTDTRISTGARLQDRIPNKKSLISDEEGEKTRNTAREYEARGNELAEGGKFRDALGKWETAITLMPERAVLYEQKAQVLLELGEAWNALKAATRATELEPEWAEAWITLGRAQLNFGEPDCAIESFDKGLAIRPDAVEAKDDRKIALNLVKRRRQLHLSGVNSSKSRFLVQDKE